MVNVVDPEAESEASPSLRPSSIKARPDPADERAVTIPAEGEAFGASRLATAATKKRSHKLAFKVALAVGVPTLAALVAALVLYTVIRSLRHDFDHVTQVQNTVVASAFEMEINVIGYGLGVMDYLETGRSAAKDRMADDRGDFLRFHATYDHLANSLAEQEFSARLSALFQEYETLGRGLAVQRDQRAVDGMALMKSAIALRNAVAAEGIEVSNRPREQLVAEIMKALNGDPVSDRVIDSLLSRLADELRAGFPDSATPAPLTRALTNFAAELNGASVANAGSVAATGRFLGLRDELDALIDDQIQQMANRELAASSTRARTVVRRVSTALWLGGLAILLAALFSWWLVLQVILRPMRTIRSAMNAVRAGEFGYRIGSARGDELGDVTREIDATIDLLERTTVSVREVMASRAELQLREADNSRLTEVLEAAHDVVALCTLSGDLLHVNEVGRTMLGSRLATTGATNTAELIHPDYRIEWADRALTEAVRSGRWHGELDFLSADGMAIAMSVIMLAHHDAEHEPSYVSVIARDISELRSAHLELTNRAMFDALTGLPNRFTFIDRLNDALQRSHDSSRSVAALFLDIDRFKAVNDSLGHAAGDELLLLAGQRLTASVRAGDTVGRLGGDEFVVVCDSLFDVDEPIEVAKRIVASFEVPFVLVSGEVFVSTSIGIAIGEVGQDAETILANADVAVYRAKQSGRGGIRVYDEAMRTEVEHRHRIENDLRHGLLRDELFVEYQPVVRLDSSTIVGVEALVRWRHPNLGLLGPDQFIWLAEESSLIDRLDEWVFEAVCRQLAIWSEGPGPLANLSVSINVSGRHLARPTYARDVLARITEFNINAARLTLEVTETALVHHPHRAREVFDVLRAAGIRIAIDDFGTGYSSLSYLQQFPFDVLKIDRSFVADLTRTSESRAIVGASVALARSLGYGVVAEGVETAAQVSALIELGCEDAQGYYFSPSVAASAIEALLPDQSLRTVA